MHWFHTAIFFCVTFLCAAAYIRPLSEEFQLRIRRTREQDYKSQSMVAGNGNSISDCICTLNYKPVCGSNGKTYGNDCILKCDQKKNPDLKMKMNGVCTDERRKRSPNPRRDRSCICIKLWAPVCGTDGKTYANGCVFECARKRNPGLKKSHGGECSSSDPRMDYTYYYDK